MTQDNQLTLDTISKIAKGLRRDGKIVAFTHGAFDLFHYGHLYLLEKTAAHCDYLIVGLECDANISDYKSMRRPIITEDDRLAIIHSLKSVGTAFIYRGAVDDYEYHKLYQQLDPHFISIGKSFGFKERVQERAGTLGIGLEILGERHFSTTKVIERIMERYTFAESQILRPNEDVILEPMPDKKDEESAD